MWEVFYVSIHEYLHTLAHDNFYAWAADIGGAKEHTLVEGFCDFFTLTVQENCANKLADYKQQIEGSFYNHRTNVPTPEYLDLYPYEVNEEAERMVGIVGINNVQLGYFKGLVEYMGQ